MGNGIRTFYLLVILGQLSIGMSAQAGEIRLYNIKISPGLTYKSVYDDNIYLGNGSNTTTEQKKDDWSNHFVVSLFVDSPPNERGGLRLGYQGTFAHYTSEDQNDWDTHQGIAHLNYKSPGGLFAEINDTYLTMEDPHGSENQYKLGIPQTERWSNSISSKLGFEFQNHLRVIGYFKHFKQDYPHPADYTQDYKSKEWGVGTQTRILSKTWGFFRYYQGDRDYYTHPADEAVTESNDSDFNWESIHVGLTWDPKAKMKGELNVGYQWKDYENERDVNGNQYGDKDTWIAESRVSLSVTQMTAFAFSLTRALREAGSDTNEYYQDTGFGLSLNQRIHHKLKVVMSGVYNLTDYNTLRIDETYNANLGMEYIIQDWLTFGLGYYYKSKVSNDKDYDYTNNQFMVIFKIK